eukprot:636889-Pelagomonas_calceolata.AAC.1
MPEEIPRTPGPRTGSCRNVMHKGDANAEAPCAPGPHAGSCSNVTHNGCMRQGHIVQMARS